MGVKQRIFSFVSDEKEEDEMFVSPVTKSSIATATLAHMHHVPHT